MTRRIIAAAFGLLLGAAPLAGQTPVELFVGFARTEAERGAVRLAVTAAQSLSAADFQANWRNGLLFFSPDIEIETGDEDTFGSAVAKVTGSFLFFSTTTVDGVQVIDMSGVVHAFPIALGAETDRGFDNVAGILEVGYVPWFSATIPVLGSTRIGVFAQGGYKVGVDTTTAEAGGAADESDEAPDSFLLRGKGSIRFAPQIMLPGGQLGFGIRGRGDLWYDVANSAWYHRIEGTVRLLLGGPDRAFEFTFEDGAGAPTFNEGEQVSAGLRVTF